MCLSLFKMTLTRIKAELEMKNGNVVEDLQKELWLEENQKHEFDRVHTETLSQLFFFFFVLSNKYF